jgi:hypothetical protein
MYFSLFCGRAEVMAHASLRLGSRAREAWTFVALVAALVGLGLTPRPLVDSRFVASEEILRLRQERMSTNQAARNSEALQLDGNFVVYDRDGAVVWSSGTFGNRNTYLRVQDDGNLVVVAWDGRPLWDRSSRPR